MAERDRAKWDRAKRDRVKWDRAKWDRAKRDMAERDRAERDTAKRDRAKWDRAKRDRANGTGISRTGLSGHLGAQAVRHERARFAERRIPRRHGGIAQGAAGGAQPAGLYLEQQGVVVGAVAARVGRPALRHVRVELLGDAPALLHREPRRECVAAVATVALHTLSRGEDVAVCIDAHVVMVHVA
jgi:hypothetical protein